MPVKPKGVEETVQEIVEPLINRAGYELVEVEFLKEGGQWYLRLFIDQPAGITLDDCEKVSRRVETILDERDPIQTSYILEVSSPGVERKLKKPADFDRFAGKKVRITTFAPFEGRKEFVGELQGMEDNLVVVSLNGGKVGIPLDKISLAHLSYDF